MIDGIFIRPGMMLFCVDRLISCGILCANAPMYCAYPLSAACHSPSPLNRMGNLIRSFAISVHASKSIPTQDWNIFLMPSTNSVANISV